MSKIYSSANQWLTYIVGVIFIAMLGVAAFLFFSPHHWINPQFPMSSSEFSVQPISHPDPEIEKQWQAAQQAAISSWNNSNDEINISIDSSSENEFIWSDLPAGMPSSYLPSGLCYFGQCTFQVALSDDLRDDPDFPIRTMGVSVISHEIAHVLGVADKH